MGKGYNYSEHNEHTSPSDYIRIFLTGIENCSKMGSVFKSNLKDSRGTRANGSLRFLFLKSHLSQLVR
jgi:hypothetical protein